MAFFTRNQKGEPDSADQPSEEGRADLPRSASRRKSGAGSRDEVAADELRRRARRCLVGAIAMVLAAVIVLPIVLDSEPQPLPENIPIQIPGRNSAFQADLRAQSPTASLPPSQVAAPVPAETAAGGTMPAPGAPPPVQVDPR